jgi:hypothetical protein
MSIIMYDIVISVYINNHYMKVKDFRLRIGHWFFRFSRMRGCIITTTDKRPDGWEKSPVRGREAALICPNAAALLNLDSIFSHHPHGSRHNPVVNAIPQVTRRAVPADDPSDEDQSRIYT